MVTTPSTSDATSATARTPLTRTSPPCVVFRVTDAAHSAKHEIALWFPEGLTQYNLNNAAWVYEG